MKLVTYANGTQLKLGLLKSDGIVDLRKHVPGIPSDMIAVIGAWSSWQSLLLEVEKHASVDADLGGTRLLSPVLRPGKIMAIGLNYKDHIQESGMATPQKQLWFSKMVTAVNGPFDPIQLPAASSQLDYEAELVAVIGKRCRHVSKDQAPDVIFGYCIGNDVSVRDWQLQTPQWVLGKSFDTHAPLGPWLVTSDEIADPHALGIRSFVNGELRQNSNTKHLLFNVYDQIEHLSKAMTLEPGDLLFTGTPGGVGMAMKPPCWLKAGDNVRVEIDQLSFIEATVEAELPA